MNLKYDPGAVSIASPRLLVSSRYPLFFVHQHVAQFSKNRLSGVVETNVTEPELFYTVPVPKLQVTILVPTPYLDHLKRAVKKNGKNLAFLHTGSKLSYLQGKN